MKHLIAFVSIAATFNLTAPAFAGEGSSCHFHGTKPAAASSVLGCADQRKLSLVKTGKLDASWQAVQKDAIELVNGSKGKEWKVVYKNPGVTDQSKATLYMFFTHPGNFVAANFTGQ
ncbi:MAG: hypothetical protein A3D95_13040 [Betaproteobacteria bacterium RIFCSPHIGHO2_12_FULL_69_13]|nr:MAG: hypothetical protein A3D95_13040 [Betaproteobacteria bacterium RIFCSPHIGHO2_12_FULL_69_13]